MLADTLLQREALVCRLAEGRLPRDFAGLYVARRRRRAGARRTARALDGAGPARAPYGPRLAPRLAAARPAFAAALAGDPRFAELARAARLDRGEAEVLALLAAVELSPARQRLVRTCRTTSAAPAHPGDAGPDLRRELGRRRARAALAPAGATAGPARRWCG